MLNYIKEELKSNEKLTTNGAKVLATTGDVRLDFFAEMGSMRELSEEEIIDRFMCVFNEHPLDAMKLLFHARNRDAVGERRTARVIFRYLASTHSVILTKNLHLLPHFGRWDDVIEACIGTESEDAMIDYVAKQLKNDLTSKGEISLAAKWIPSENTSSTKTKYKASRIRKKLGLNSKEYRRMLSVLRAKIKVTETYMSSNNWSEIDYSKITSKNNLLYSNAFAKHDKERYTNYIDSVNKGESKMNTGKLFPYEVVRKCLQDSNSRDVMGTVWNQLPNYVPTELGDSIAVCDTSYSMECNMNGIRPLDVAMSLSLYFAERNVGQFKNHFLTFSSKPQLIKLEGKTLYERLRNMNRADWGMNTNLEAVFTLLLNTAVKNNMKQEDMVKRIIIISDMNIDRCTNTNDRQLLFMDAMRNKYASAGYELPAIVFWNVNSKNTSFLASKNDANMALVSGASASIFSTVISGKTPMDVLKETVLENHIYSCVKI